MPKQLQTIEATSGKPDDLKSDAGTLRVNIDGSSMGNTAVAKGNITFGAVDLTVEILTAAIALPAGFVRGRRDLFQVQIETPALPNNDLTILVYNVSSINATARDCQIHSFVVPAGGAYRVSNVEAMFIGDGTAKLGAKWAADTADTPVVYWRIVRV